MMMKWTVFCVVALALLGSFCDAQGYAKPGKPSKPQSPPTQNQQQLQTFEKELTWRYPDDPQPDPKPNVPFELRYPVPAATVAVECRESIAHVEVKKDMFGTGQPINPNDLTLGNCAPVGEDSAAQVLIYEAELHQCGSQLMMTNDALIYTFVLNYNPTPLGSVPVVRTSQAAVIVECHYPRKHNVSSLPLDPLWVPFSAVKMAEEFLYFTMKLMTDDWMYERPSYQYFLGDLIRIEVTVKQYFHVPLRVYVDRCVATLSPDVTSSPNYAFIDNFGCLIDARITGSDSKFMARTQENHLQFQLEAFRFQNSDSGVIYITCYLKATSTSQAIDSQHRACSYTGGWREASGVDGACGSCETNVTPYTAPAVTFASPPVVVTDGGGVTLPAPGSPKVPYNPRKVRDVTQAEILEWEGVVSLGPIPIMEKKL
ncbi:zona pellucida sperm-binding protein 3-like precursor [Fundulus heteroclitus]|uniref:Zona pellucida sperm-binding protein 3 n=1 Tax=Fundulus heteroclitus TaxID=8078 RepID=D5MRY6_FUNHE|nr:zona pellucida sperm-binding protein 3-like precursor [Fundulus heteroclitus]BAJ07538.1 choriogenin L [Fundulus heteroclitus]